MAEVKVDAIAAELMAEVRRHLNGVVAAAIRNEGAGYPFCLGVPLPTLREIGRRYAPNQPLARLLLSRAMRESMLLASIIGDPSRHNASDTQLWVDTFKYGECIEVACADYFWKLDSARQLVYEWLFMDELKMQRAGITLLANLYRKDSKRANPSNAYTLDQLYRRIASLSATAALFQPLLFLSQWLARSGAGDKLIEVLNDAELPQESHGTRLQLVECIRFEREES